MEKGKALEKPQEAHNNAVFTQGLSNNIVNGIQNEWSEWKDAGSN